MNLMFCVTFNLSSANTFSLDKAKTLSSALLKGYRYLNAENTKTQTLTDPLYAVRLAKGARTQKQYRAISVIRSINKSCKNLYRWVTAIQL